MVCVHHAGSAHRARNASINRSSSFCPPQPTNAESTLSEENGGSARVLPDLVHHSASPSIDVVGAA